METWGPERQERQPEVCAYLLVLCGLLAEIDRAHVAQEPENVAQQTPRLWERFKTYFRALLFHKEDVQAIHPRFVVRNTISPPGSGL